MSNVVGRAPIADGAVTLEIAADETSYTFAVSVGGASHALGTLPTRALSAEEIGKRGRNHFTGAMLGLYATATAALDHARRLRLVRVRRALMQAMWRCGIFLIAAWVWQAADGARRRRRQEQRSISRTRSPGYVAGPREPGDGYVRRTYTAGATRITVTLARHAMDRAAYDGWVAMSTAGFPQADLGLPADAANGFYQCEPNAPESCDLLIQLRSGVHVEIRGGGTSTRRAVDAIRAGLPLAALANDRK